MSQWELVKTHKRSSRRIERQLFTEMDEHMCAEGTYSALELGAGETQTTLGEDRLTSLLFLHHGEAVPVSPAQIIKAVREQRGSLPLQLRESRR